MLPDLGRRELQASPDQAQDGLAGNQTGCREDAGILYPGFLRFVITAPVSRAIARANGSRRL